MDNQRLQFERIIIQGIKSIRYADIPLTNLNVVVGPNGAGKSNLLFALKLFKLGNLSRIHKYQAERFFKENGGPDKILFFKGKEVENPSVEMVSSLDNGNYADATMHFFVTQERVLEFWFSSGSGGSFDIETNSLERNELYNKYMNLIQLKSSQITNYHFHDTSKDSRLKKDSANSEPEYLLETGQNLAKVIFWYKSDYPIVYNQLVSTIHTVAPYFLNFKLDTSLRAGTSFSARPIILRWIHASAPDESQLFHVSDFSDGTLRFIALATALLQPDETLPPLIMLDEPELGLHPYAIAMLAGLIKLCAQRTQVIVATQSPTLLSHFSPDDVIINNLHDGESTFYRLLDSSIPKDTLAQWLEDMTLGELWANNWIGGSPHWRPES